MFTCCRLWATRPGVRAIESLFFLSFALTLCSPAFKLMTQVNNIENQYFLGGNQIQGNYHGMTASLGSYSDNFTSLRMTTVADLQPTSFKDLIDKVSTGALYDAGEISEPAKCHPGT